MLHKFKVGDRIRVNLDYLPYYVSEDLKGYWRDKIVKIIKINNKYRTITVDYPSFYGGEAHFGLESLFPVSNQLVFDFMYE